MGIVLRHHKVQQRDKNSYIVGKENGDERETQLTEMTTGNISLSFNDSEIVNYLQKIVVKSRSKLMDERKN